MKIKLSRDTFVRLQKGAAVEVSDAEAKRLVSINCAEIVAEEETKPKAKATKKPRQ